MGHYIDERADFGIIRYANCWEDADVLCASLEAAPGKRMLSIASAGDNALALIAEGCEVIAVDLSPAQLACVELRREAFRELDYDETLAFLGVTESSQREQTYQRLSGGLSSGAKRYWDAQGALIAAGVIHAGKFESYFKKFRQRVLPLVHGRAKVQELLREKSPDARRDFYDRRWNTWRWRLLFRVFFSRFMMGRLGRDPEFFRYVEGSVADRILQRTEYALTALPTHANPYLQYILTLLILNRSLPLPVIELAQEIILLVATGIFVTVATWRTATFNVGGTLVMILAVFGCWTLASMDWALPVFFAFAFYVLAVLKSPFRIKLPSKPVVKALLLPLLVMVTAAILQQYGVPRGYRFLYGPFLAGCVTITAQSACDQVLRDRKLKHPAKFIGLIAMTCLACAVVVLPTFLLQTGVSVVAPICVVVAALAVGISAGMLFEHQRLADSDRWWWLARMFSIMVMIGLVALAQAIGVSPVWNPR